MRRRPIFWFTISLLCFVGAYSFWRLGDQWEARKAAGRAAATNQPQPAASAPKPSSQAGPGPMRLLARASEAGALSPTNLAPKARIGYRLSNTTQPLRQLLRNPKAILLENALLDTAQSTDLPIPPSLRAQGKPGAYLVQARQPVDAAFRALLQQAGASIVSYIPNNAYLVRASEAAADALRAAPQTQSVLAYEPYYKLKPWLLKAALEQMPLPEGSTLRLLLFGGARAATLEQLQGLGVQVLGEEPTPFGPLVRVRPPADWRAGPPPAQPGAGQVLVAALAQLAGVQEVELGQQRVSANDLSRATLGVAANSVTPTNYLGLTGTNVLVALEDSGVDATHPDLVNRVFGDSTNSLVDSAGHGTHVAGIIAGDGTEFATVTNASGSLVTTNGTGYPSQFRGKAPGARLYSMSGGTDFHLQQAAALTNAFISNNSWTYGNNEYDIYAASYDAAVRNALPGTPGSHPALYVFATGNGGMANEYDDGSNDNGVGGAADTILSPATAKNVITVGAIEQLRQITNQVATCTPDPASTNGVDCTTNQPWLTSTDSGDITNGFQVAWSSGRGPVGIFIEGDTGRFKPDVVAPGTFVLSTRSAQWDQAAYYNPTSTIPNLFTGASLGTSNLWYNEVFVRADAVQLTVTLVPNAGSPVPFPNLPIFVRQVDFPTNTSYDFVATNQFSMPPDHPLNPVDATWYYGVGNTTTQSFTFDVLTVVTVTNEHGNFMQVLKQMNDSLGTGPSGPYYRYESGSSMGAADVSGMLALMQEFFEQRVGRTNSPALMKALLINGSRSLGTPYDFGTTNQPNFQGWGMPNLPATLQTDLTNRNAASSSMFLFDQDPTNALFTGQSATRFITISTNAQNPSTSLHVTLVWTDPPGNPVAGIKLVNDLDLIVTNLDTGDIFFGNDIQTGNTANLPWDTNSAPNLDMVNNVENVYLGAPLGTNYSITVVGRRVNVNAVSANTNNVVQDYALVISCGNGDLTGTLTLSNALLTVSAGVPNVTPVGNMFTNTSPDQPTPEFSGGILLHQHVGANTPLLGTNAINYPLEGNAVITLGMTNQWHFYMITNDNGFTNAAFLTFMPWTLTLPRMGVTNVFNPTNATRPEADIDLYVSRDSDLTNLSTTAVSNAWKSVGPGGDETIILTNAATGVYYAGVKSEDQWAAEYGFLGVFSLNPLSSGQNGNQLLRGFPVPAPIPDGSTEHPASVTIFAVSPAPIRLHRVIVLNTLSHELVGDLLGTFTHGADFVVLNNHATNLMVANWINIYDDSDQHDTQNIEGIFAPITAQFPPPLGPSPPPPRHTDGPGSLMNFAGKSGSGQWQLTQVDNAEGHTGTNGPLFIYLEKQQDLLGGFFVTLAPGACDNEYVDVPANATNLTVTATVVSNTGPINVSMQLCPLGSATGCKSTVITNQFPTALSIDLFDQPPLKAGTYYVRLCNNGAGNITLYVKAAIEMNRGAIAVSVPDSVGPVPIQDDAVTYATLNVTNHALISDLDIGLLINDPRVSDLAISLISPNGTRILLFQNRSGTATNGLGTFDSGANPFGLPFFAYTNMAPFWTNNFDTVPIGPYGPGTTFDGWTVLSNEVNIVPDYSIPWLQNNMLVLGDGVVSNSLPTTNSSTYHLSFRATHAPYIVGMVTWWPFDGDARDIFGGLDGLLFGNVVFSNNCEVTQAFYDHSQAYFGDGIATKVLVPASPDLNLQHKPSFTIEGWINPASVTNQAPLTEWFDPTNPSPLGVQFWLGNLSTTQPRPGALSAAFWDANSPANYYVATRPQAITNAGWQHVALTYNASNQLAGLYVNGLLRRSQTLPAGAVPRTKGDFYLGFDPPPSTFAYRDFSSPTGLVLLGGATVVSNALQLTPAAPNTNGAAWYSQKLLCSNGFSTAFTFQFTGQDSQPQESNNGLCFVFQNTGTNALSSPPVYDSLQMDSNAVAVIFESESSRNLAGQRNSVSHVWLQVGTVPRMGGDLGPSFPVTTNLCDGLVHLGQVEYDGRTVTILLDNYPVLSEQLPQQQTPGGPVPYGMDSSGQSWVGFEASSSGTWQGTHDILSWSFNANGANPGLSFAGGLDEFSLYSRALLPQEILAICNASTRGKYGTNALTTPVGLQVSLATGPGAGTVSTYTFTNGLDWAGGPSWETNAIDFTNVLQFAYTNGPATNLTPIVLTPLDPNVTVDDFVLSALTTNVLDGLMHFTDNTNLAVTPIKFAPWPYTLSNSPPALVSSNSFVLSTGGLYTAGSTIAGGTAGTNIGVRDWTVTQGSVTVQSNAMVDPMHTNFLVLATGAVQSALPTIPGHRYQLSYTLRGPGAVGWWNGALNPMDGRAQDLIGGNDGALINGAQALADPASSFVGGQTLFFPGIITNGVAGNPWLASTLELGDPQNLRLTNSFTIEGWVKPLSQTNGFLNGLPPESFVEQIFFRGDSRDCLDPYYLGLERVDNAGTTTEDYDIIFHIEDALRGDCGVILETGDQPIKADNWFHIAAVFECNYHWTDNAPWPTNMLRLYVNGQYYTNVYLEDPSGQNKILTSFTGRSPFRDLDPAYSPGAAIGNASRSDYSQPFRGFIDELSVYGRALADNEVKAIFDAGSNGKADPLAAPAQGLAQLSISLDDVKMDTANGDNAQWTTPSFLFAAYHTNTVLTVQGLLPGTLLDGVTLTEVPSELTYLPEDSLDPLLGTDAFGTWKLEIWDTRAGPNSATNLAQLVTWRLDFTLLPSNPPPVIELSHGIPYANTLAAYGAQSLIVNVPAWATNATNVLLSALDRSGNALPMGVLYDTNSFPTTAANFIFWPPVNAPATNVLSTNAASAPLLVPGRPYFLTVTNPNPVPVEYAYGVWFDIVTLTNCQLATNCVVGPAGVPRYFQFDVTGVPGDPPQSALFWLSAANSNLTVVLSEHLPLPNLAHYDYISQRPGTNQQIVMVVTAQVTNLTDIIVTNSTPFPVQISRWYVGVFNTTETNVSFSAEACADNETPGEIEYPELIPLTSGVAYSAGFIHNTNHLAAPGPPRAFFFQFQITNAVEGVLFELYNLSGNANLVLQRDVPPVQAPYFAGSFRQGTDPEQIVVRTSNALSDLSGNWYLGIYNNELTTNVAYAIRATLPVGGVLPSALPLVVTNQALNSNLLLLSWNSIIGEYYTVSLTDYFFITNTVGNVVATTPVTTWLGPMPPSGDSYIVVNVPAPPQLRPKLTVKLWHNQVRISWPTSFTGFTLQSSTAPPAWVNVPLTVVVEGNEFVVYDTVSPRTTKYYRLIK